VIGEKKFSVMRDVMEKFSVMRDWYSTFATLVQYVALDCFINAIQQGVFVYNDHIPINLHEYHSCMLKGHAQLSVPSNLNPMY